MGSRGAAAVRWPDIAGATTPSAGQPAMHSRARERGVSGRSPETVPCRPRHDDLRCRQLIERS
jgi:hypothetical protein